MNLRRWTALVAGLSFIAAGLPAITAVPQVVTQLTALVAGAIAAGTVRYISGPGEK